MKAAIITSYGSPEQFKIQDISKPDIQDNEILIRVKASSVNPVDWKIRKGNLKLILGSKFPIVLGYDASGEVVETGKSVSKFKKGDQVYSRLDRKYGRAYAEYAASTEKTFALKPEKISFEEAAAIPLAALTALQALRDKCRLKKGDCVLLNGASSGVGHFALQIVKEFGGISTAVCSGNHKKMLDELKPDYFIDYTKINFKDSQEKYDIIFDVVGMESFMTCRHLLKKGGIYITALPRPKLILHRFCSFFTPGKKVKTVLMKARGNDLEYLNELIQLGKFKAFIDKTFTLEEISKAHAYSEQGHTEGKIVIRID